MAAPGVLMLNVALGRPERARSAWEELRPTFDVDALENDGVLQVFDPAQRLCWTSPTATSGDCTTPAGDATTFGYDVRGNRTLVTLPSGTTSSYGFDAENRMTSAKVPTVSDPSSRQFQVLAGGAQRVADGTNGSGVCDGSPCGPFTADAAVHVDVAGRAGVPGSGVTAVTGTVTVSSPGWGWVGSDQPER